MRSLKGVEQGLGSHLMLRPGNNAAGAHRPSLAGQASSSRLETGQRRPTLELLLALPQSMSGVFLL